MNLFAKDKWFHLAVGFVGVLLSFVLCWLQIDTQTVLVGALLAASCNLAIRSVGWLKEAWDENNPGHVSSALDAEVTKAGADLATAVILICLVTNYV